VPAVRVTSVLPTCFTENIDGALMSYQSLRRKGSSLLSKGTSTGGAAQQAGAGCDPPSPHRNLKSFWACNLAA